MEKEQTRLEVVRGILKDPIQLQLIGAGFLARGFAQEADKLEGTLATANKLSSVLNEKIKMLNSRIKIQPEKTDDC